jgi:hypothetical protein
MQLQLRPSAPRFHPLVRPMYRRAGFAGLGLTPGYTPEQQAMADAFRAQYGGAPATVYQAPTPVAVPACSQDTRPGGAAFSAACIAQLLAAQQQNMQLANNANFQIDYANCVGQGIAPADCASRTYGLTPAGGYTSDAGGGPGGSQAIVDANGNPVSGVVAVYTGPPLLPVGGSNPPAQGAPSSLKFTNLSSGNASTLKVGERWQIQITGAARNAPVSVTGGQNGAHDTTPMGSSDASGNWSSNGQITADQIGSWSEAWTVGGQPVGQFSFTVVPATTATGSGAGQTVTTSFMDLLNKSTTIGGTSIPDWALVGGALFAAYFLFMRGK